MSEIIKIGEYNLSTKSTHILLLDLGDKLKKRNVYFEKYASIENESAASMFIEDYIHPLSREINLLKWVLNCPAGNDDDELYIQYYEEKSPNRITENTNNE